MNVIDYITITCNKKKKCLITDYIRLHDKMQSITTTNYDDPMSANQHQELPVSPVNYCFQQFTVSTLVFVLTYVYAFSTFPCRHASICVALYFILFLE